MKLSTDIRNSYTYTAREWDKETGSILNAGVENKGISSDIELEGNRSGRRERGKRGDVPV